MRVDGGQRAGETRHDRDCRRTKSHYSHGSIVPIRGASAFVFCLRMTVPLGRFAMAYSQHRIPTYSRRISTTSTQLRDLGLRYQQLESSVRSTARKAALLEEMTDTSRLVEQHSSLSFTNKSQVPREKVETFHGLVIPQEPKPPEPDGEFFMLSSILSLILKGLVARMLHVRMCGLRLRSLRGRSLDVQGVTFFTSDAAVLHGDPTVGMAFTRQVFVEFSGCRTTIQPKS